MLGDKEFEKWLSKWDDLEKTFAQERAQVAPPSPNRTTYFNAVDADEQLNDADVDWRDMYHKAANIDYNLLTDAVNIAYAGSEGYGRESVPGNATTDEKKKKVYLNNPIHYASVGNDQDLRVSKNWSQGPELEELADVKKQVEEMERKFHDADVLEKSDKSKLQTELNNLRERMHKLSQKVTPDPQEDYA